MCDVHCICRQQQSSSHFSDRRSSSAFNTRCDDQHLYAWFNKVHNTSPEAMAIYCDPFEFNYARASIKRCQIKCNITHLFLLLLKLSQQPFAAWIVDRMEFANRASVAVILATLEVYAMLYHAMHDVRNTANARMVHASAHKDGMAATALCVSIFNNH